MEGKRNAKFPETPEGYLNRKIAYENKVKRVLEEFLDWSTERANTRHFEGERIGFEDILHQLIENGYDFALKGWHNHEKYIAIFWKPGSEFTHTHVAGEGDNLSEAVIEATLQLLAKEKAHGNT